MGRLVRGTYQVSIHAYYSVVLNFNRSDVERVTVREVIGGDWHACFGGLFVVGTSYACGWMFFRFLL